MTSDEAFTRIVRGHPWIVAICIALPLLAVVVLQAVKQPAYSSATRVQVTTQLAGSTTEADAASNRAIAIVTSPSVVDQALAGAGMTEDPTTFVANSVQVNRIGVSPIVEVLVTTDNARDSVSIATSLGSQLVDILNQEAQGATQDALNLVDSEISTVQAQRTAVATKLLAVPAGTPAPALTAQLAALDSQLAALNSQRSSLVVQAAAPPLARTIDPATTPQTPNPSGLLSQLGLGLVLGVLLALAAAGLVEALRPKVSAQAAARRLEVPYLGDLGSHAGTPLVPIHRRVAELAQAAGAASVVVTPVGRVTAAQAAAVSYLIASALHTESAKGPSGAAGSRVLVMPLGNGQEGDVRGEPVGESLEWRPVEVAEIGVTTDPRTGFVALASHHTPVSRLRSLQAQIEASGRPLLAVVGVRGHLGESPSTIAPESGVPGRPEPKGPNGVAGPVRTGSPSPERPDADVRERSEVSQARPNTANRTNGAAAPGRPANGTVKPGQPTKPPATTAGQPKPTGTPAGDSPGSRRG